MPPTALLLAPCSCRSALEQQGEEHEERQEGQEEKKARWERRFLLGAGLLKDL